ncbi:MAG: hypothetical protein COA47_06665 [Robiginitomaculum sp.]|nr:MAG: hypothetical protein COA47_06665 [Robiginitomaculum sp.]
MAGSSKKSANSLHAAERAVIKAARTGVLVDFSAQKQPPEIRSEVLFNLLVGLPQAGTAKVAPVTARGLRIVGANITGCLDLSEWSARADDPAQIIPSIQFSHCTFSDPIYLDGCHIQGLELVECQLPALFALYTRFDDPVRLNGSRLAGAEHKDGAGFFAMLLDRALFSNGLFLRPNGKTRFHALAQIRAQSAVFEGDFSAVGAHLQSEDGIALDLFTANITGGLYFMWRGDLKFRADGDILMIGLRIAGGYMATEVQMSGRLDFSNGHVGVLADNPVSGWPEQAGQVSLSGLSYTWLRIGDEHRSGDLAGKRLNWLKLQYKNPEQPTAQEFDPQPFHQLAQIMRQQGMNEDADRVSIEMRTLRLSSKIDPWYIRKVQTFLNWTCRFGFSGGRAISVLSLWILLGTMMFGAHAFSGSFSPAEAVMMGRHDAGMNTHITMLPFPPKPRPGQDLNTGWHQTVSRGCPGLVAPLYAIDVILPVIEFGQRRACAFDPMGPLAPLWRWLHLFYALIGAILSAIAVVTLTGLLRRD